jgi:hypothetical protein
MEMLRLDAPLARRDRVAAVVDASRAPVVLACPDGSAVILAASLAGELTGPVGVWLEVTDEYPAALAARDVATLAWLVDLALVVVEGASAPDQADVVRALLTSDEVNFANPVATLRGAYNRPAPPRPVAVWSYDGAALVSGDARLLDAGGRDSAAGALRRFA